MVTRLSGGLTPADGSDPRTFPAIWNVTADEIESQGTAISGAESDIDVLEGKNIPAFGTATPSDGQVLTFDSGASEYVPEDVAASLADLTDTDISSPVSGEVLEYDGTSWVNATAAGGGKVLQVVSTTKTDTFSTTSTSFVDITGLSASITPSSTSSKILVNVLIHSTATIPSGNPQWVHFRLMRDATPIFVGDSAGSREQDTFHIYTNVGFAPANANFPFSGNFLDSPNTTSSVTYKMQGWTNSTSGAPTLSVNRSVNDSDSSAYGRTASTITLMEVAG